MAPEGTVASQALVVGPGLEIRLVAPGDLREQDLNAQVMEPQQFDRLVANVRKRGQLESLPYCVQPNGTGPVVIVSGHHRVRAAKVAELATIPVLVDTLPMSRSEMTAKQIAHNALVGRSDEQVLRQMLDAVTEAEDLLATGLDETFLQGTQDPVGTLLTPQVAVEWRLITLAFLPAQLADFRALIDAIEGSQDLVGVAPVENYADFAQALGAFSRVKDIRSIPTVVAVLTKMALTATADHEEPADVAD